MRLSDLGNGKMRNPVLFADYSDPDVIRVGDTFYMTASSFNYTPGLPILTSKDLVNWELVNYALDNIKEERYDIPRHSEGVWAPAIRFHDGMFYIYYGMPDEGYYVVRTKDPFGKWDDPVCVLPGKGLIDPCPIWDDDGKAYIVHGYAKSRIGFNSILGIFEMSPDGLEAISEDHFIFDGNDKEHPAVTIEGPKIYKRDGLYYIWAPAGGVRPGYQVVLKSSDIFGPYEIRTVMDQGDTLINGPHQGGLVDTEDGKEYFLHFQDRGLYGRICHLQPVTWKDGWPVVGKSKKGTDCGEPVYEMDIPVKRDAGYEKTYLSASDDFKGGSYGLCWQWLGNHYSSFYGKAEKENGLRLYALNPSKEREPVIWKSANVLTQKIIYPLFTCDVSFGIMGLKEGDRAGVCMTGGQYITAYVEKTKCGFELKIAQSFGGDSDKKEEVLSSFDLKDVLDDSEDVIIRMRFAYDEKVSGIDLYYQDVNAPYGGKDPHMSMELILKDGRSKDLGVCFEPLDHTWVGAKIGIFALSKNLGDDNGFADFNYVKVDEL